MLTANRLRDGDVVYWRAGGWVEAFGRGDVFAAEVEAEAALEAAHKSVAANVVVNPYLFDVRAEADGVQPVTEREIIRAAGPTTRLDLGKQAEDLSPPPARLREELRRATSPQGGGESDNDVSL